MPRKNQTTEETVVTEEKTVNPVVTIPVALDRKEGAKVAYFAKGKGQTMEAWLTDFVKQALAAKPLE